MVLKVANRVREESTTTGTGTYDLNGAAANHETFVQGIGDTNTCHYLAIDKGNAGWEVGVGTITDASPDTLARTTILASSNSDAAVDWPTGTRYIMCIWPADQAEMRKAVGLIIGTDVQAFDAQLADVAGLVVTDGSFIVGDGINFVVESGATVRTSLGLAIGTDVLAQQTIGIADNNLLEADGLSNANEYARFTASGLVGRTEAEFKGDFSLELDVDVQAFDAGLLSIAGLTTLADRMIYTTASDVYAVAALTAAGRALIDDANAAAQRTTLGLVIDTDVDAFTAIVAQAEAEAGTATTRRTWTAERVKQAIDALVSGGLTSISNTAITAITNVDVTGFASATYDNYEVWISNSQPGNNSVILEMETSTDGGTSFDTGVSDYSWAVWRFTEAAATAAEGDADDSEIQLTGADNVGNAANENINCKLCIFGPEITEFTSFTWHSLYRNPTTILVGATGAGDRQSAADVDALRFHWSAGDWVAQGNIQFLGIGQ